MFTFIFLVYLYIIRIRGCDFKVFVSYNNQNLLYYNMNWFVVCYEMIFMLSMHLLSCVPSCTMRAHCNPISIVFGNKSIYAVF